MNRSIELLVHYLIKVMDSTIQEEILELIIIAVLKKEPVNCGRKYEIPVFLKIGSYKAELFEELLFIVS